MTMTGHRFIQSRKGCLMEKINENLKKDLITIILK